MSASLEANNDSPPPFWELMLIKLGKVVAILPFLSAVIFGLIVVGLCQIYSIIWHIFSPNKLKINKQVEGNSGSTEPAM